MVIHIILEIFVSPCIYIWATLMVLQTPAMIVKEEEKMKRVMDLLLPLINITIYKIKKCTNVSVPIDDSDATTKKFVTDLLKTKAGTGYVNNELAKNTNTTTLKNYALEKDLQALASEVSTALDYKVDTQT